MANGVEGSFTPYVSSVCDREKKVRGFKLNPRTFFFQFDVLATMKKRCAFLFVKYRIFFRQNSAGFSIESYINSLKKKCADLS